MTRVSLGCVKACGRFVELRSPVLEQGTYSRHYPGAFSFKAEYRHVSRRKVRVAIVGVGNCASAFVQGIKFYESTPEEQPVAGLMHDDVAGYRVGDIEISVAFDIDARKVGEDLSIALASFPNNTVQFAKLESSGVRVERGPTLDGLGRYTRGMIHESPLPPVNVADALKATRSDVVVSYLPVGSQAASEYYAGQALEAGCGFVNCMPVFLASSPEWQKKFEEARLPIVGDDIKSQVGATIVHRAMAQLFEMRGVQIARTYQLNFGGNTDFLNMLDRDRLESKKRSKTQSVNSQLDVPLSDQAIHVGPSDYVAWLEDRKVAHIRLEGVGFGRTPISMDIKLEVHDSPNSAGSVIDAVRCAKLAMDRGLSGALIAASSFYMKSPPVQLSDHEAYSMVQRFIDGAD